MLKRKKHDLEGANNPWIAARRVLQAQRKAESAQTAEREVAIQAYLEAATLLEDAANRWEELRHTLGKRMNFWNFISGDFYQDKASRVVRRADPRYMRLESETELAEIECRRRLACYAASEDDATVARCIGDESVVEYFGESVVEYFGEIHLAPMAASMAVRGESGEAKKDER